VVDHRVHGTGGDSKEESWAAEFEKIAMVTVPIGLGDDGYAEALGLEDASDNGCSELGVVDIGIPGEEDDVHCVPATQGEFFAGGRKI